MKKIAIILGILTACSMSYANCNDRAGLQINITGPTPEEYASVTVRYQDSAAKLNLSDDCSSVIGARWISDGE